VVAQKVARLAKIYITCLDGPEDRCSAGQLVCGSENLIHGGVMYVVPLLDRRRARAGFPFSQDGGDQLGLVRGVMPSRTNESATGCHRRIAAASRGPESPPADLGESRTANNDRSRATRTRMAPTSCRQRSTNSVAPIRGQPASAIAGRRQPQPVPR
jgi:hypothetical protein